MKTLVLQYFKPDENIEIRDATERINRAFCAAANAEYVAAALPDDAIPGAVAAALDATDAERFLVLPGEFHFAGRARLDDLEELLASRSVVFPCDAVSDRRRTAPELPNPRIAFGRVDAKAKALFVRWRDKLKGFDASRFASVFWRAVWPTFAGSAALVRDYYRIAADGGYLLRRVATSPERLETLVAFYERTKDDGSFAFDFGTVVADDRANVGASRDGENADATPNGDDSSGGTRGGFAGNVESDAETATASGAAGGNGDGDAAGGNGNSGSGDGGSGDAERVTAETPLSERDDAKPKRRTKKTTKKDDDGADD